MPTRLCRIELSAARVGFSINEHAAHKIDTVRLNLALNGLEQQRQQRQHELLVVVNFVKRDGRTDALP